MAQFQPGNPGGPGRPRKRDKHAGAIAKAEKKIADRLPKLVDNMLALADGVTVQEVDLAGRPVVYTRAPDRAANEYLLNRIMGKPTERKELTGADGGPVQAVGLTLDEWRAQAAQRLAQAEAALAAAADEEPETDAP